MLTKFTVTVMSSLKSLCYTLETNTMLYVNYISIKLEKIINNKNSKNRNHHYIILIVIVNSSIGVSREKGIRTIKVWATCLYSLLMPSSLLLLNFILPRIDSGFNGPFERVGQNPLHAGYF